MNDMDRPVQMKCFEECVAVLRARFPSLKLTIQRDHPEVHAMLDIGEQPGMDFSVNINLQNHDELHLSAGTFWVEWFPCQDKSVFDAFMDAAVGLIAGTFRIVEYYVGSMSASAVLQRPVGEGWKTITGRTGIATLIPWPRRIQVLQNTQRPNQAL